MTTERTYKRKGIGFLVGGVSFLMFFGGLGLPYLANHSDAIFHRKTEKNFHRIEQYYDKNRDGKLSLEEKYFMYSKFGLESESFDYFPEVKEMKRIIEEYHELDKAQFGIFDSIPLINLEKEL